MKKLSRTGVLAGLVLAAVVAGYLKLIFLPQMAEISDANSQIETRRQFVLQANVAALGLVHLEQQQVEARQFVAAQRGYLASSRDLPQVLAQITEAARAAGVTITALRPSTVVGFETFEQIPLQLGCRGDFIALHALLVELERLPQPLRIGQVRMEAGAEDGANAECEISLEIFAGNFEESGQVTPAGQPIQGEPT